MSLNITQRDLYISIFENLENERIKPIERNIRALVRFVNSREFKQMVTNDILSIINQIENSDSMQTALVNLKKALELNHYIDIFSNLNIFDITNISTYLLDDDDGIYKILDRRDLSLSQKKDEILKKMKPKNEKELREEKKRILNEQIFLNMEKKIFEEHYQKSIDEYKKNKRKLLHEIYETYFMILDEKFTRRIIENDAIGAKVLNDTRKKYGGALGISNILTGIITGGTSLLVTGAALAVVAVIPTPNKIRRTDKNWLPEIRQKIFEYFIEKDDDYLRRLINNENLEDDFPEFRECLIQLTESVKSGLGYFNKNNISEDLVILELKRGWSTIKYTLTNEQKSKDEMLKYIEEIKIRTSNLEKGFLPSVSFDFFEDSSRELKLKLKFRDTENIAEVARQLNIENYLKNGDTLEAIIDQEKKEKILRYIYKLSDLNIASVMFGEFGIMPEFKEEKVFNPRFNRIYGNGLSAEGFISTVFSRLDRGGHYYYCPDGWRRYSLMVANSPEEFDRKYGDWPVAYHGTATYLAVKILSGIIASKHGCYLKEAGDRTYYTPSIEYAGHPRYAKPFKVKGKWVQMVLQIRLKRSKIEMIKPGTLDGAQQHDRSRADPNFDNSELEWISFGNMVHKEDYVIYGIMVRVFDGPIKNNPKCRWWGNNYLDRFN